MKTITRRQFVGVGLGALATMQARLFAAEPRMSWLDNGTIRVGVDLAIGGAITWLSRSGSEVNLINSFDWGRQVQLSYYGGPVPFVVGEKRPAKHWEGLGWNPIQAGDDFGHGSRTIEQHNDGRTLYVKCVPMQWPLDNEPGECNFESWLELDGATVKARARLVNARSDRTQYAARTQELPAVYTNGPWHRLLSYTGARPFTGEAISTLEGKPPPQWNSWLATENWSALVDDAGWGLGVWNPDCVLVKGGFAGKTGAGGPRDNPCGYLAPLREEVLDHNITHEFRYDLVLGTVEEIRAHVYRQPRPVARPAWRFEKDRQGWSYRNAQDAGWPIRGELRVALTKADSALISPQFFCRTEDASELVIDAAFATNDPRAQVFWATLGAPDFAAERLLGFEVKGDGEFREYRVRLAGQPGWRGAVVQLRIDPANAAGGTVRVRSIRLEA